MLDDSVESGFGTGRLAYGVLGVKFRVSVVGTAQMGLIPNSMDVDPCHIHLETHATP